jgi:ParB/RepB/Spo0J family partition protein
MTSKTRTHETATPAAAPSSETGQALEQGEFRNIPLNQLTANPLNGRKELRDIEDLAQSIRQVGILQDLTVRPHGTDNGLEMFQVCYGHRRFAAAKAAGQATVPCRIRHIDDAQLIQEGLIENLHRNDLTFLEEAEKLGLLMDMRSITVKDLANAVGRSVTHVSNRLSLLSLPQKARNALDTELITLGTALALTEIADYPDSINDLIDDEDGVDPDELNAVRRHITIQRESDRLREEAAAKGLRLVEGNPRSLGYVYLAELDNLTPRQVTAHARQSCHAVYLEVSLGRARLTALCANPARHQPPTPAPQPSQGEGDEAGRAASSGDGAVRVTDTGQDPNQDEDQDDETARQQAQRISEAEARRAEREKQEGDERRNRKRVTTARREFLTALAGKRTPKRADAVLFTFTAVLDKASANTLAWVGKILGLQAATGSYGTTDWRTPIATYATQSADELLKSALLISCHWAEEQITQHTAGYNPAVTRYIETLTRLGYTPDPYETEQIQHTRQQAAQAEQVAQAAQVAQTDDDADAADADEPGTDEPDEPDESHDSPEDEASAS